MEMYPNGSSFGASLTLQTSNSFRDVSFSSYLNQNEEHMIRKLTNQASDKKTEEEDEELGVFGAENYFKEEIEDVESKNDERSNNSYDAKTKLHQQEDTIEEFDHRLAVKVTNDQTNMHTPSVRSNVSCNSRARLLPRSIPDPENVEREKTKSKTKTRMLLATFGCNCINKKSTQINEKRLILARQQSKPQNQMIPYDHQTVPLSSKPTERTVRNDYFSFPVLNSTDLNSNYSNNSNSDRSNTKFVNLAGKVVEEDDKNGCRLSLGKKLSLLHDWDSDIETDIRMEDEMYIPSSGMYNKDNDSDSSSDLFEIESFSTTGNNSYVAARKSNGYAPSEVSVDWSVVTASAADFEEMRFGGGGGGDYWRFSGGNDRVTVNRDDQKKRPGILSGCVSHKAVRVVGDGYKVGGGGVVGRRRLSDSIAVGSMFRRGFM